MDETYMNGWNVCSAMTDFSFGLYEVIDFFNFFLRSRGFEVTSDSEFKKKIK